MDWQQVREQFPALEKCTYLNTAGGCAMSRRAAAYGRQYFDEALSDGDLMWPQWLQRTEDIRSNLAIALNTTPDAVAFFANASAAYSCAAQLMNSEAEVLLIAEDFPSVTLPWLQAGAKVRFLETDADGGVPIHRLEEAITPSTKSLALSHVQYHSGYRFDLDELCALRSKYGLQILLDTTQSFGAFSIDMDRHPVDAMVFSGYKWSTAGYGIAGLYVAKELRKPESYPSAGWRSAEVPYDMLFDQLVLSSEARSLELGHPPFPGIFALGGALEILEEIGINSIEQRIDELCQYLHEQLKAKDFKVSSSGYKKHQSGITMLELADASETVEKLKAKGIFVSIRGGRVRISVHFYNTKADIDRFIATLCELSG